MQYIQIFSNCDQISSEQRDMRSSDEKKHSTNRSHPKASALKQKIHDLIATELNQTHHSRKLQKLGF